MSSPPVVDVAINAVNVVIAGCRRVANTLHFVEHIAACGVVSGARRVADVHVIGVAGHDTKVAT